MAFMSQADGLALIESVIVAEEKSKMNSQKNLHFTKKRVLHTFRGS